MNKDRVKGVVDEMAGSAKRKAGALSGNTQLEIEGMVQQVKGKAEEVVHDANEEAAVNHKTRIEVELECAATPSQPARKP